MLAFAAGLRQQHPAFARFGPVAANAGTFRQTDGSREIRGIGLTAFCCKFSPEACNFGRLMLA
jgi:hypothetical protein